MIELDPYLDHILSEADVDDPTSRRFRGEVREHLEALVQRHLSEGKTQDQAVRLACEEFGEPSWVGRALQHARGGWRSWRSRFVRPLPIAFMFLFLGWTVNTYAFEVYSVVGSGVSPRVPQGSHVIVEKWGPVKSEDIVVYKSGERSLLGIVGRVSDDGTLSVIRRDIGWTRVDASQVVGRVVCSIR